MVKFVIYNSFALVYIVLLSVVSARAQYSPTPTFQGKIGKTISETEEWYPRVHPQATKGAPNVLWILIDDIGYGATTILYQLSAEFG